MVTQRLLRAALFALCLASAAQAQPARLHHAPVSVATASQPLEIKAEIDDPQLVRRALLVYRTGDGAGWREVEFLRASDGPYVARIPAEHVQTPWLAYTIELESVAGARTSEFATREAPHRALVPEDELDLRERALDQRLDGRRSVFSASGEYVSFGESAAIDPASGAPTNVDDRYFRVEGAYTYRPLRIVTEFGVRGGTLRGKAPVPVRKPAPGQSEDERFDVGLDYGGPRVRFRFADFVHADGELVVGFTEVGFSWGGGGAVLIGDPYGSKLTLGFESLQVFGTRLYSRMDLLAAPGIVIAPLIEVTNMPSAEDYGVRLLGEVSFDVGAGLSVAARGGYQARVATSGGPSAGAMLAYAF